MPVYNTSSSSSTSPLHFLPDELLSSYPHAVNDNADNTEAAPAQSSLLAYLVRRDPILRKDSIFKTLLKPKTPKTTQNLIDEPATVDADGWLLDPEDFSELPPVLPLTPDAAPPALWGVVNDVCNNAGSPVDFLMSGLMVFYGALLSLFAVIRPKKHEDLLFFPNIFGVLIADVSSRKSFAKSILSKLLAPLVQAEKMRHTRAEDSWRAALSSAKLTNEIARKEIEKKYTKKLADAATNGDKQEMKALHKQIDEEVARCIVAEPPEPKERSVVIDSINFSTLISTLEQNPAVFILADEISETFENMQAKGNEQIRKILLSATNGDGVGDKTHTHGARDVEHIKLSLFGTIQPDRLDTVRKFDRHSGFSERLQEMVWPDVEPVFDWRDEPCKNDLTALVKLVELADKCAQTAREREQCRKKLLRDKAKARDKEELAQIEKELEKHAEEKIHCCFGLSEEARGVYTAWHKDFLRYEHEKDAGAHGSLLNHARKMPFFVLKEAAIYEFIQNTDKFNDYLECVDNRVLISEEAIRFAIARCKYLMSHAARFHRATSFASILLDKMRSGRVKNYFSVSELDKLFEVKKLDPEAREAKRRQIRSAVDELENRGWIRKCKQEQNPLGGRPTVRYELHPSLLNHDRF